jgi:hypothetical protein
MADAATWFRSSLIAHAGTTALVGERVYFLMLPQNPTYPAITLQKISAVRPSCMGDDVGKVLIRMQVTSWASSRAGVEALREQSRQALQRARGTVGGVTVDDTYFDNEVDDYSDEVEAWFVAQDFRCWVTET